jgi:hypothetical protein
MQEYLEMTRAAGLSFVGRETFYTGRKLTAEQAREEIAFACTQVPVIYGVATRPFEEAWGRFGREIEENGMGQYSRVVLVSCLKTR